MGGRRLARGVREEVTLVNRDRVEVVRGGVYEGNVASE